jgi:hypothetical protein
MEALRMLLKKILTEQKILASNQLLDDAESIATKGSGNTIQLQISLCCLRDNIVSLN